MIMSTPPESKFEIADQPPHPYDGATIESFRNALPRRAEDAWETRSVPPFETGPLR